MTEREEYINLTNDKKWEFLEKVYNKRKKKNINDPSISTISVEGEVGLEKGLKKYARSVRQDTRDNCTFAKYKVETCTHYIGVSGTLYDKEEYANHGFGGIYKGFKDLPKDDYPYTKKYDYDYEWEMCKVCDCK